MTLRNGGLLISACLSTCAFGASDSATYSVGRTIDRVQVGDVTVQASDEGISFDADVTLPACPGLSRLAGHLTFTWTSATGETLSHTLRVSNGSQLRQTNLSFEAQGSYGSAVGGSLDVTGSAGCTGD